MIVGEGEGEVDGEVRIAASSPLRQDRMITVRGMARGTRYEAGRGSRSVTRRVLNGLGEWMVGSCVSGWFGEVA